VSLAGQRTAIKAILGAVTGIGIVHDYLRLITDEASWREAFVGPGGEQLLAWTMTRESSEELVLQGNTQNERYHLWVLRAYMGVADSQATERTFQDLLEAACDALRVRPTLSGAAQRSDPPQVRAVEHRMFGSVLAHYGEIVLRASDLAQYTTIP